MSDLQRKNQGKKKALEKKFISKDKLTVLPLIDVLTMHTCPHVEIKKK